MALPLGANRSVQRFPFRAPIMSSAGGGSGRARPRISVAGVKKFLNTRLRLPRPINALVQGLQPQNLARSAVTLFPFSTTGLAGEATVQTAAGRTARGAINAIRNTFKNTLQPTTLGSFPKKAVAGILGAALPFAAYDITTKGFSKDAVKALGRQSNEIVGLGINPVGGLLGIGSNTGYDSLSAIKDKAGKLFSGPTNPTVPLAEHDFWNLPFNEVTDYLNRHPLGGTDFGTQLPSYTGGTTSVDVQAPSFNPALSVGGGGPSITELLLLLGATGAGGFLLGRRKKKRKYKKRRKR